MKNMAAQAIFAIPEDSSFSIPEPQSRPAEIRLELETLQQKQSEIAKNVGKYVLIKGKEVIAYFATYGVAINTGYKRFGLESFLVRQIKDHNNPLRVARCGVERRGSELVLERGTQ
jgi:hypothetical protein